LVFLLIFILAVVGFLFYFRQRIESPNNSDVAVEAVSGTRGEFVIADGQSASQVSHNLVSHGFIDSSWSFQLYLKFKKLTIKSGDYLLPTTLNQIQIAEILSDGSHQVKWITIKDGWRREQVAAYLSKNLNISSEEFLAKSTNLEGKLFPDTYKLSDEPTVDEAISKMTENYQAKTDGLSVTEGDLALASIIQKEAGPVADMPEIAAVFNNRIKIAMKLQSDVTSIYQKDTDNWQSVGLLNYKFWQPASGDTTKYPGPYNTYSQAGLPPTPICTPSLAAINSVLHPGTNSYLFFLYGKDGKIYFAKTQAEQTANINKYLY